jgi:hypothetical protein
MTVMRRPLHHFIVRVSSHSGELAKAPEMFPWVKDVPRVIVRAIGIAEILGALGLILPVATGIYPWLTPLAAAALALLMFMAATFHAQRREGTEAALNLVLLVLLLFIAYSRWELVP